MTAAIAWVRKWAGGIAGILFALFAIGWVGSLAAAARRRKMESVSAASYANAKVIWAENRVEAAAARKVADSHLAEAKRHAVEAEQLTARVTAAKQKLAAIREELGI